MTKRRGGGGGDRRRKEKGRRKKEKIMFRMYQIVSLFVVGSFFLTTTTIVAFFISPTTFTTYRRCSLTNLETSSKPLQMILNNNKHSDNIIGKELSTGSSPTFSKIATYDIESESCCLLDNNVTYFSSSSSSIEKYDLQSPREWLEYCEVQNNMTGGAYTVIRCDFHVNKDYWRIWGNDFHFQRLQESFHYLLFQKQQQQEGLTKQSKQDEKDYNVIDGKLSVQSALNSTTKIMNYLLGEARTKIIVDRERMIASRRDEEKEKDLVIVIMLTILWEPNWNNQSCYRRKIRVRGHAFTTFQIIELDNDDVDSSTNNNSNMNANINPNQPIKAVIGHLSSSSETTTNNMISSTSNYNDDNSIVSSLFPNRYQNYPKAKLSSWCRRRRLLENLFKKDDVGEVILVKSCNDEDFEGSDRNHQLLPLSTTTTFSNNESYEILEGLTSNIFIVYGGKIIKTPPITSTLEGYGRKLVIDCAVKCGYQVEIEPIRSHDSSLWKEVFFTSSIRLIVPVRTIFLPSLIKRDGDDDGDSDGDGDGDMSSIELNVFWDMGSNNFDGDSSSPVYDILYNQLMK